MINLSECKFGDKLKTRDGRMALFLGEVFMLIRGFSCSIKDEGMGFFSMFYRKDGTVFDDVLDQKYDIVGKWEDEK